MTIKRIYPRLLEDVDTSILTVDRVEEVFKDWITNRLDAKELDRLAPISCDHTGIGSVYVTNTGFKCSLCEQNIKSTGWRTDGN